MKRQPPGLGVDRGHRQFGQELAALGDDDGVDDRGRAAVQAPAATAPVHRLDRKPIGADQQQHHQRGGQAVLRVLAQQLVVESRPLVPVVEVSRSRASRTYCAAKATPHRRAFRWQRGQRSGCSPGIMKLRRRVTPGTSKGAPSPKIPKAMLKLRHKAGISGG